MKYIKFILILSISVLLGYYIYIRVTGLRSDTQSNKTPSIVDKNNKSKDSQNAILKTTSKKSQVIINNESKSSKNGKQQLNREQLAAYTRQSALAFAGWLNDPENFKAYRAQAIRDITNSQSVFFKRSSLTTDQKKQLIELLVDQRFGKVDVLTVAYDDPKSRYALSEEVDVTFETKMTELLGEENAKLYDDFSKNTRAWNALDHFISHLDENCPPLDSDQEAQLLEILKQNNSIQSVAELRNVDLSFLSSEQISYYNEYIENENLIKKATDLDKEFRNQEATLKQKILNSDKNK